MSRRCPGCGGFFGGDVCPNQHDEPFESLPPLVHGSPIGDVVRYQWPGEGPVLALITSDPDADGMVGLMVLHENVRANVHDVERIDDGGNLSTP